MLGILTKILTPTNLLYFIVGIGYIGLISLVIGLIIAYPIPILIAILLIALIR